MKKIIVLLSFVLSFSVLAEFSWDIRYVYNDNATLGTGFPSSIGVDDYNRIHIAHHTEISPFVGDLYYTYYDGQNWSNELLRLGGSEGLYCDLEIDSDNEPNLAFAAGYDLVYGFKQDGTWQYELVKDYTYPRKVQHYLDFELDSDNNPYIVFNLSNTGNPYELSFAYKEAGIWVVETICEVEYLGEVSLALDSNGQPHISFTDWSIEEIYYAYKVDGNWQVDVVDDTIDKLGLCTAIACDNEDNIHILYIDHEHEALNDLDILFHSVLNSKDKTKSWTREVLFQGENDYKVINYPKLVVDKYNKLHASWLYSGQADGKKLMYGQKIDSNWETEIVDAENEPGRFNSLDLKTNGKPVISYQAEDVSRSLRCANFVDYFGSYDITFNIADNLEADVELEGYGVVTAVNGTAIFNSVPKVNFPGINFSVSLDGYTSVDSFVVVDENEILEIDLESNSSINDNYELQITNYELKQNYPNPFNPVTKINFQYPISNNQYSEIVVHNSLGQQVWSSPITNHALSVTGSCIFDGSNLNSGIYYYSLIIDGKKIDTKSMVLIK